MKDRQRTQEEIVERLQSIDSQVLTLADDLEVDSEGQVWLLHNGERIAGPYEGWISTTIAESN